jgi:hypothetical protein
MYLKSLSKNTSVLIACNYSNYTANVAVYGVSGSVVLGECAAAGNNVMNLQSSFHAEFKCRLPVS